MKKARLFTGIAVAATAAIAMTTMASAYDLGDKNLGKNWTGSLAPIIAAEEFADITENSYITITFTADPEETEYWCIKPCVNITGWPFVDPNGVGGPEISEGKDSYPIADASVTSITFKVPADVVDGLKESGMAIMGHSLTLHEMTISDEAPTAPAPDNGNTDAPTADKNTPDTGVEGVAVIAALAIVATGAVVVARKRK